MVIEVSYNYDENPDHLYCAEVEFIPDSDWSSELNILFDDLHHNGKLHPDHQDPDTEAGVAYDKIRAVYDLSMEEMLLNSKRDQLMGRAAVREVLGTTRKMAFRTAPELHRALLEYVDSRDKQVTPGAKSDGSTAALRPLVKGKQYNDSQ